MYEDILYYMGPITTRLPLHRKWHSNVSRAISVVIVNVVDNISAWCCARNSHPPRIKASINILVVGVVTTRLLVGLFSSSSSSYQWTLKN